MADITMCKGVTDDGIVCDKKDGCYRYRAVPDRYQSFFLNAPVIIKLNKQQECEYYWEINNEDY